jgi:tagatose-1,6-bisphosphate aldolase non-catalytic subunit AgaZ/GatZ
MRAKEQARGSSGNARTVLKRILEANQRGEHTGIYSVCSANQAVLEAAMQENPSHWKNYHHGDEAASRIARKYSYSDRSRYHWGARTVRAAVKKSTQNFGEHIAPVPLLIQFLPNQAGKIRAGEFADRLRDLIRSKIREVTRVYSFACGQSLTEKLRGRPGGRKTIC